MMEAPQLHGFGPAANRLLEAYNTIKGIIAMFVSIIDPVSPVFALFKFLLHPMGTQTPVEADSIWVV
jgi:hypothetical protein